MKLKTSLNLLSQNELNSDDNISKLITLFSDPHFGQQLMIAIEIAGNGDFLSQQVLDDFFNNIAIAWQLARVLKHFKTANLIPDYKKTSSSTTSTSAAIVTNLEAELQKKVYQAVLNNLPHLHALEFNLRYLVQNGLLKNNIDKVLNNISKAHHLNLALHNLSGSLSLDQTALDALYADPEHASQTAKNIYSSPLVKEPEKVQQLVVPVVNQSDKKPERIGPVLPRIRIYRSH